MVLRPSHPVMHQEPPAPTPALAADADAPAQGQAAEQGQAHEVAPTAATAAQVENANMPPLGVVMVDLLGASGTRWGLGTRLAQALLAAATINSLHARSVMEAGYFCTIKRQESRTPPLMAPLQTGHIFFRHQQCSTMLYGYQQDLLVVTRGRQQPRLGYGNMDISPTCRSSIADFLDRGHIREVSTMERPSKNVRETTPMGSKGSLYDSARGEDHAKSRADDQQKGDLPRFGLLRSIKPYSCFGLYWMC